MGGRSRSYVFRSSKGTHLIQDMARYYWKQALKKAGLPYFPIRQLRHSLATDQHCRQAWPAKTVSAIEALAGVMEQPR